MCYPCRVIRITLAALDVGPSEPLPDRFRLFARGVNHTEKGPFLFDETSAASVLAYASQHAVDGMVDLEHLSLDLDATNYDPDARAWYRLEVIEGDLWATHATWTPDGERRLRARTQRYPSPAFETDDSVDPPRITKIFNVGLTALPATHGAFPLVASSHKENKMNAKVLARLVALRADGVPDDEIMNTLAIDMKSLQAVVKAMGGDPQAPLGQLFGVVSAYAKELADMAAGKEDEPAGDAAGEPADEVPAEAPALSALPAELVQLRAAQAALAKSQEDELARLRKQVSDREAQDRVELTASIVRAGGLTPAVAWSDASARVPSEMVAKLSVADLSHWLKRLGGQRSPVVEPPRAGAVTHATHGPDISDYEAKRVEIRAKLNRVDPEIAIDRYLDAKQRQLNAAELLGRDVARFGRRLNETDVIATVTGKIGPSEVRALTNAVRPHETFGTTAQRAIEEFRLDLMVNVATTPDDWTQTFGLTIPGGTSKDTFPLDFSAVRFYERLGQSGMAETPQSRDIQLTKREFRCPKQGNLRKIQEGDFAFIRSWQQGAAQMARAKMALRASLVKTILEAGTTTYWGASATQSTGVEGVYYFATTHKVHPFDPRMTIVSTGASTWSNYQSGATPLNTSNLFTELDSMLYVPHFDGEILGTEGDAILLPTSLVGVARRMFDQQAFRSDGETSSVQMSNEFFGHPMARVHAPQLAGSGATANYYILSTGTIAMGFSPWVVAEDSQDEILIWDESSDFYRQTGDIKIEEKTYINAALAWPQGIRYVKGS